jgi:hypothetical protein
MVPDTFSYPHEWQATIAATHGLESTLRKRGRPSKMAEKKPVPFNAGESFLRSMPAVAKVIDEAL